MEAYPFLSFNPKIKKMLFSKETSSSRNTIIICLSTFLEESEKINKLVKKKNGNIEAMIE